MLYIRRILKNFHDCSMTEFVGTTVLGHHRDFLPSPALMTHYWNRCRSTSPTKAWDC